VSGFFVLARSRKPGCSFVAYLASALVRFGQIRRWITLLPSRVLIGAPTDPPRACLHPRCYVNIAEHTPIHLVRFGTCMGLPISETHAPSSRALRDLRQSAKIGDQRLFILCYVSKGQVIASHDTIGCRQRYMYLGSLLTVS